MSTSGAAKNAASLFAVVLAAGESRRFGSQKQLVRIAGRPLLHTTVTGASEVTGSSRSWCWAQAPRSSGRC
jgi:CTP:molybdopterin cytidylyltransferase MocA